jgi:spore coat polysaccharide biosynthesis protein SpsF
MTSTIVFLQARMGSTRLPGKVMLRIQGQSILERAIRRLQAASLPDAVVVLTTARDEDDVIVAEAHGTGVEVFRGADLDVLARFRQAADFFQPDIIIRATADNPLIDIGSVDRILRKLAQEEMDYCMERGLPIGAATEAFTRRALESTDRLGLLPHHREHVTTFIKEHTDDFRVCFLDPPQALQRPDLRITVDTQADFVFMQDLIGRLPESGKPIPLEAYLQLLPDFCSSSC